MKITKDNNPPPLPEGTAGSETAVGWRRGMLLGKGSFGSVHMATVTEPRAPRFEDLPPVMAVKSPTGPSTRAMLESEMFLLLRFADCPNIIRCLAMEETPQEDGTSRLDVFLELASGGTLAALIRHSDGPLHERVARRYASSILAALKWMHDEGYVHCDLKPENVLLVEEGGRFVAKVGDLGSAKRAGKLHGAVRGTMCYLAPETARLGVQDKASDIWALGCVVLKMLGGKLPWEGCDKRRVRAMIATGAPVSPKGASWEAVDFLRKCFLRDPRERPTARELMRHPFVMCPDPENTAILDEDDLFPCYTLLPDHGSDCVGEEEEEEEDEEEEGDDDGDDEDDNGGGDGSGDKGQGTETRAFWGRQWIADLLEWFMLKLN